MQHLRATPPGFALRRLRRGDRHGRAQTSAASTSPRRRRSALHPAPQHSQARCGRTVARWRGVPAGPIIWLTTSTAILDQTTTPIDAVTSRRGPPSGARFSRKMTPPFPRQSAAGAGDNVGPRRQLGACRTPGDRRRERVGARRPTFGKPRFRLRPERSSSPGTRRVPVPRDDPSSRRLPG